MHTVLVIMDVSHVRYQIETLMRFMLLGGRACGECGSSVSDSRCSVTTYVRNSVDELYTRSRGFPEGAFYDSGQLTYFIRLVI